MVHSKSFQTFWYRHLKLKIQHVIDIHRMRWLTNFYDFTFKGKDTAAVGIHPTIAWLSQLGNFKNAICMRGHVRRTICNKMPQKRMECFWLILEHLTWIEHLSGIRDSRKRGILWGMMRCVGRGSKSIHYSWLAKRLGLGLLCWGFKGFLEEIPLEEIPLEEASTLQIGSVAFPPGQYTNPQLNPCHRLFDEDGYQNSSSASL